MRRPRAHPAQASKGTARRRKALCQPLRAAPLLCCVLFGSASVAGFIFQHASTRASSAVDGVQPAQQARWWRYCQDVMGLDELPLHVAGALVPVIAANPLEVVKVQLQSSSAPPGSSAVALAQTVFERDGIKGFFRGLPPALAGICPAIFTHISVYFMVKNIVTRGAWAGERHGDLTEVLCGSAAILAQTIVTNPIAMVQTRMQLGSDRAEGGSESWREVAWSILAGEGRRGFYQGLLASCLRCSENLIVFTARGHVDRWLKNRLVRQRAAKEVRRWWCRRRKMCEVSLPRSHTVVPYMLIKLFGILVTYPFEVARTRQREQAREGASIYKGLLQSVSLIRREEGLRGLYAGAGTHLARVVAGSASLACLEWYVIAEWIPKPLSFVDKGFVYAPFLLSKLVALILLVCVETMPHYRPGPKAWPM